MPNELLKELWPVQSEQIMHFLVPFLITALFALIICKIAYSLKVFSLPKPAASITLPLPFAKTLGAFVTFIALQIFLFPLVNKLFVLGSSVNKLKEGVYLLVIAGGMLLYAWLSLTKKEWRYMWDGGQGAWKRNVQSASFGSLNWFVAFPTVTALASLLALILTFLGYSQSEIETEQVAIKQVKNAFDSPLSFTLTAILLSTTVPFYEELLFRGFLQTYLKKALGLPIAIIGTSLVFSLFHFAPEQGIANVVLLISLFALSCCLGFLFERQRSLWASIGLHATYNLVSITALIFS